jgi:hypothetical protein
MIIGEANASVLPISISTILTWPKIFPDLPILTSTPYSCTPAGTYFSKYLLV